MSQTGHYFRKLWHGYAHFHLSELEFFTCMPREFKANRSLLMTLGSICPVNTQPETARGMGEKP